MKSQVQGILQVYWKEKLKFKWGNESKSRDKNLPEVKARKRKVEESVVNTDVRNVNLTWGMANYLPPQLESEDDTASDMHIQSLKREYCKTEKNKALADLKMKLSFSNRRKEIVTDNMPIGDILEIYPFLKDRRQVHL